MSYRTFSSLGESGGMCSQLQSYASLLAVAKANNKEVVFSKSMFDKGCGIKIFDLLKIFLIFVIFNKLFFIFYMIFEMLF